MEPSPSRQRTIVGTTTGTSIDAAGAPEQPTPVALGAVNRDISQAGDAKGTKSASQETEPGEVAVHTNSAGEEHAEGKDVLSVMGESASYHYLHEHPNVPKNRKGDGASPKAIQFSLPEGLSGS